MVSSTGGHIGRTYWIPAAAHDVVAERRLYSWGDSLMRLFSPKGHFPRRSSVTMPTWGSALASAVVFAAALVSCGGGSSPAPATSAGAATVAPSGAPATAAPTAAGTSSTAGNPSDACSVVTKADVEAAFGGSSTAGKSEAYGVCTFQVSGTLKAGKPGDTPLGLRVFFDIRYITYATIKPSLGDAVTKVDGLGSEAYYSSLNNLLHVQVPGGMLTVGSNMDLPDKAIQQQSTIDLAKAILARL